MSVPLEPAAPTSAGALIGRLKTHVQSMGDLAVGMVQDGTRALLEADRQVAASVTARDPQLDRFDIELETETMRLIAVLQPEGPDLRTLGAVLKIATCLDRVGRLGYDLAQYVTTSPEPQDRTHQELLRQMDTKARAMVGQAIHAFVHGDVREAKEVFALDDEVDALHEEVQHRLLGLLQRGGVSTDRLAYELLAARHLERVGDNACKIAEKTVYAMTGERRAEYFPQRGEKPGHPGPAP